MLADDLQYAVDFSSLKPTTMLQPYRVKPELGDLVYTLAMDMLWFVPIAGVKEEPLRPDSQHRRHAVASLPFPAFGLDADLSIA